MKNNIFLLFFPIFLVVYSCDSGSENFEVIETGSPYNFHSIEEYDNNIYATGGDVWNKSNLVKSSDGITWTTDSLTNKSIFDLHASEEYLYAVGNDGYIFRGRPDLELTRTSYWGMLRGFTTTISGSIAVGGKDFNKGWIYKVNSNISIDTTFQYAHELADIKCAQTGQCIAIGYGIILSTNDEGSSWSRSDETGDFFNSIAYNKEDIPYIVGYNGSILKSIDRGENWNKIKDAHSPLASNQPFRKIKFYDHQGYIVGDNGTIWKSSDNGDSWQDISLNTNLDLYDFIKFDNQLIAVSEEGRIVKITLD